MRKVLLNSSQVSVLLTTVIVILSTLALFLSGYAIQQRTLRELRAAIRPRESPKAHLPEYFQKTMTRLEDGTFVSVESEAEREAREQQETVVVEPSTPETDTPQEDELSNREPMPEKEEEHETSTEKSGRKATKKQMQMLEKIQAQVAEKSWAVENPDPLSKNKAPITRAERRKMIRDEIQKLSQSDRPVYYQRRLW